MSLHKARAKVLFDHIMSNMFHPHWFTNNSKGHYEFFGIYTSTTFLNVKCAPQVIEHLLEISKGILEINHKVKDHDHYEAATGKNNVYTLDIRVIEEKE